MVSLAPLVLVPPQSIGQMGPNLQAVAEAQGAAAHLLAVCRRKPSIDAASEEGLTPSAESLEGRVELRSACET